MSASDWRLLLGPTPLDSCRFTEFLRSIPRIILFILFHLTRAKFVSNHALGATACQHAATSWNMHGARLPLGNYCEGLSKAISRDSESQAGGYVWRIGTSRSWTLAVYYWWQLIYFASHRMALGGLPFEQNPEPQCRVLCLVMSFYNPPSLSFSAFLFIFTTDLKHRDVLTHYPTLQIMYHYVLLPLFIMWKGFTKATQEAILGASFFPRILSTSHLLTSEIYALPNPISKRSGSRDKNPTRFYYPRLLLE